MASESVSDAMPSNEVIAECSAKNIEQHSKNDDKYRNGSSYPLCAANNHSKSIMTVIKTAYTSTNFHVDGPLYFGWLSLGYEADQLRTMV